MTEDIMTPDMLPKMGPEAVVAAALYLVSEDAPNRVTLAAGAGGFGRAYITLTRGIQVASGAATPETVASQIDAIGARDRELVPDNAFVQSAVALGQA
jgi:hypothetical protein